MQHTDSKKAATQASVGLKSRLFRKISIIKCENSDYQIELNVPKFPVYQLIVFEVLDQANVTIFSDITTK